MSNNKVICKFKNIEQDIAALKSANEGESVKYADLPELLGVSEFDKNELYTSGTVIMHDDKLYYFSIDHEGEWDENDVVETDIITLIQGLIVKHDVETASNSNGFQLKVTTTTDASYKAINYVAEHFDSHIDSSWNSFWAKSGIKISFDSFDNVTNITVKSPISSRDTTILNLQISASLETDNETGDNRIAIGDGDIITNTTGLSNQNLISTLRTWLGSFQGTNNVDPLLVEVAFE